MNNIWHCPHLVEVEENPEELQTARYNVINAISAYIDELVIAPVQERRHIKAAKSESAQKLPRSKNRSIAKRYIPGEIHEVNLSGNLSITLCERCYAAIEQSIVVRILQGVKE